MTHTRTMSERITFLGAAGTVTGSRHLIESNGKKILVDCGLFQGGEALRHKNWEEFPVDPRSIDAIVLTHAHMDHIGYLPKLVREGYSGPIYATSGTIGLCKVSLPDGGRIQEEEARFRNKHRATRHDPALPLYTEADAYNVLKQLVPVHYFEWQELPAGMQFRYKPAGHILGSGFAEIYFANGEQILMSGDLGRYDRPIIKDPTACDFAEYLVIESTYGDRLHGQRDAEQEIKEILQRGYDQNSVIIVPSFAIGRTQEMLWYFHVLQEKGEFPDMPVYVDSPMATATTLLYVEETEEYDKQMQIDMREGKSPFRRDMVTFIRDREASKQLNTMKGPFVVIAGSGMMNGGRVLHHVKSHIDDPSTIVVFTGYQAEGTKGRELLDGAKTMRIYGEELPVKAEIRSLDMLSAHADWSEMVRWLKNFKDEPKMTFVVHGERPQQEAMAQHVREELGWSRLTIPTQGDSFGLS